PRFGVIAGARGIETLEDEVARFGPDAVAGKTVAIDDGPVWRSGIGPTRNSRGNQEEPRGDWKITACSHGHPRPTDRPDQPEARYVHTHARAKHCLVLTVRQPAFLTGIQIVTDCFKAEVRG